MPNVRHSTVRVGPANVFYREAGTQGRPVLLLLDGFANSSHYFRHLMPKLAGRFHLIAPDLPSFGFTTVKEREGYQFTFAGLTKTIQGFVNELSLRHFAMYVFDYGAPAATSAPTMTKVRLCIPSMPRPGASNDYIEPDWPMALK